MGITHSFFEGKFFAFYMDGFQGKLLRHFAQVSDFSQVAQNYIIYLGRRNTSHRYKNRPENVTLIPEFYLLCITSRNKMIVNWIKYPAVNFVHHKMG